MEKISESLQNNTSKQELLIKGTFSGQVHFLRNVLQIRPLVGCGGGAVTTERREERKDDNKKCVV